MYAVKSGESTTFTRTTYKIFRLFYLCLLFTADSNCNETSKLQQHLSLLREEYQKLQNQKNDIERKYTVLSAANGNVTENSFVSRLLKVITDLYDSTMYR